MGRKHRKLVKFDKSSKKGYNKKVSFFKKGELKLTMNKIKKLTLTLFITSILLIIAIPSSFASTGTITVDTLRVRKAPSTSSDVVRNFDKGDKVEVIEKKDEWYKIKLTDGKEAYVYAEYVKLEENNTTNEETKQETQKEEKRRARKGKAEQSSGDRGRRAGRPRF